MVKRRRGERRVKVVVVEWKGVIVCMYPRIELPMLS